MSRNQLSESKLLENILEYTDRMGIYGNYQAKKQILLACVSTFNLDPDYTLSVILEGEAGIGKTSLVKSVLSLFPEEKIIQRSRMTPKALEYMEDDLDRKIVFIEELSGNEGRYSTKIAISEHCLKLETVESSQGAHQTRTKEISAFGTSFITTTTQRAFDKELESRIVRIYPECTPEYRSHVIRKILEKAELCEDKGSIKDISFNNRDAIAALTTYKVLIPFATELQSEETLKLTFRDVNMILANIQAHTLLYQEQREKINGYLEACLDDYNKIKDVLHKMLNPTSTDHIKIESAFGNDEFTVNQLMDIYEVESSQSYNVKDRLIENSIIKPARRGKYTLNYIELPDIEVSPVIPAIPAKLKDAQENQIS